jgi:hypothetical protein
MCVFCVYVVLCLVIGLATSLSPVQWVLPSVNDQETEKSALCSKSGSKKKRKQYYPTIKEVFSLQCYQNEFDMHSSSCSYQFVHCYNILLRVHIKKFFILHLASASCSFLSFRSKYYCMHTIDLCSSLIARAHAQCSQRTTGKGIFPCILIFTSLQMKWEDIKFLTEW